MSTSYSATIVPFEVPESVRAFAERGVSQARENYARLKDAAETNNGAIEASLANASKGASAYVSKLLDIARANTEASLTFTRDLLGVKTLPEAVELWSSFTREQFEAFSNHTRELAELGQKIATDTVEPLKSGASKVLRPGV